MSKTQSTADVDQFVIDFYSKYGIELTPEKVDYIHKTYGDDYNTLINDLYGKYAPGQLTDEKYDFIETNYGLKKNGAPSGQPSGPSKSGIPFTGTPPTDPLNPYNIQKGGAAPVAQPKFSAPSGDFIPPEAPPSVGFTLPEENQGTPTTTGEAQAIMDKFVGKKEPEKKSPIMLDKPAKLEKTEEDRIREFLVIQAGDDAEKQERLLKLLTKDTSGNYVNLNNNTKVELLAGINASEMATIDGDLQILQDRKIEAQEAGDMETAAMIEEEQIKLVDTTNDIIADQQKMLIDNPEAAAKLAEKQIAAQNQDALNKQYLARKEMGGLPYYTDLVDEAGTFVTNALVKGVASSLVWLNEAVSKPTANIIKHGSTEDYGDGNNLATEFIQKITDEIVIPTANIKVYDPKTGDVDLFRLIPELAGQAATMALLIGGGNALSKATGVSQRMGLQLVGAAISFDDSLREGMEAGMNQGAASTYAFYTSAIQGMLEGIMPDSQIVFGSKQMAREFALNFLKDKNLAVKSLLNQAKNLAGENAEEFAQRAAQLFGNYATNATMSTQLEQEIAKGEVTNTAILTTATVLLMGAGNHVFSNSAESKRQVALLAQKPKEALELIETLEKTGKFKQENVDELRRQVNSYANAYKKMPPSITEEKKVDVVPKVAERERLAEENKEVVKPLQAINNEKIEQLDKEILEEVSPRLAAEENTDGLGEDRAAAAESTPVEVAPAAGSGARGVNISEVDELKLNNGFSLIAQDAELTGGRGYLFELQDAKGEKKGQIELEDEGQFYRVVDVSVKEQKRGTGADIYTKLSEKLDKPLHSDTMVSEAAKKLWERLVSNGIAEKNKDGSYQTTKKSLLDEKTNTKKAKASKEPAAEVVEDTAGDSSPVKAAVEKAVTSEQGIEFVESEGVGVELTKHKDGVRIDSITSKDKGKGNASKVLKEIAVTADEKGLPVYLDADAKKGGMPQEELVKFYKKNGFVFQEGSTEAVRLPVPKLSEKQKETINAEAKALGFENVPQALNSVAKRTGQYYTSWDQVPTEVRESVSQERLQESDNGVDSKKPVADKMLTDALNILEKSNANSVEDANTSGNMVLGTLSGNIDNAKDWLKKQIATDLRVQTVAINEAAEKTKSSANKTVTNTPVTPAEPTPKPAEKSKIEVAREKVAAAKAAREKARSKSGITPNQKERAKADFEYHKSLVELALAYIETGVKKASEFAKAEGLKFTKTVNDAWKEARGAEPKTLEDFTEKFEKKKKVAIGAKESDRQLNKPSTIGEGKEGPKKKKRRFTKQVLKAEDISENLKEAITQDQKYYNLLPNSVTLAEANSIIDYLGEDESIRAFLDLNNGMSLATRYTVGQILIKRLQQIGDYDAAIDVLERLTKSATEAGQGIQALSMFGALTPEGAQRLTQKEINKQRKDRADKDKKKTKKIISGLQKANEEGIKEVFKKPEVKKKVEKAQVIKKPESDQPASYGSANKVVSKKRYNELRAKLRGKLFSNPIDPDIIEIAAYHLEASGRKFTDFSRNMIKDLGTKVKPYLKEIYAAAKEKLRDEYSDFDSDNKVNEIIAKLNTDHLVKKMEAALKKGNAKEIKKALAALQNLSKQEGLWGRYKDMAASRLKSIASKTISNDINESPILEEFTNGLVRNIREQIQGDEKAVGTAKKPKAAIEIIADAYKNFEKYKQVWEQTQEEIMEKYKDDPDALAQLDEYFGEIMLQPFSKKLVETAIREELKTLDQKIEDIAKAHFTVFTGVEQSLTESLIEQAGLNESDAAELAQAIHEEFNRIVTEKKKAILERMFSTKERKKPEVRTLESELIKLTNLGAFSDADILNKYAEKMGYPKLSPENLKEIARLATNVQVAPEGLKRFRAIEDLLTYQQKIKGVSWWDTSLAVWYANILSGPTTQLVNTAANIYNTAFLGLNIGLQGLTHGSRGLSVAKGFYAGFLRGLSEGKEVLRSGYNPIRENKVEVPPVLEFTNFIGGKFNPANYLKYVRRLMVASDTLFFESQKEMRAYQLASKQARAEGKLDPTLNQRNRALEIINKTDTAVQDAIDQANSEYKQELLTIKINSSLTEQEKKDKSAQAKRDIPRRIQEIIEKGRSEGLLKESQSYAARGTFNYIPQGVLGIVSHGINQATSLPNASFLKLLVPFTNIIANVVNETLNYTPLGHLRALRGGTISGYKAQELTDTEKVDLHVKALIGEAAFAAMLMLAFGGDDDKEPWLEITANGYGDYKKNYDLGETGWQPYSMRVKNPLTGKYGPWIQYKLLPINAMCTLVGNMVDAKKYRKYKDPDIVKLTSFTMGETAASLFNSTALSSINTAIQWATNFKDGEKAMEAMVKQFGRTAKSFVIPNLFNQTSKEVQKAWDIPLKETSTSTKGVMGALELVLGEVIRDIPVARDIYYNKVNGLGEEISPDTDRLISYNKDHPVFELLKEKGKTTDPPSIKTKTIVENDVERSMSQKEYNIFCTKRGEIIKSEVSKDIEKYRAMTDEQFTKEWRSIKEYATTVASVYVLDQDYKPKPRKPVNHKPKKKKKKRSFN